MQPADGVVRVDAATLDLAAHTDWTEGLPHPRWREVHAWLDALPEAVRDDAWLACQRAWVSMLRHALGERYRAYESPLALLLTTHDARGASVTLQFLGATHRRVQRLLEELAQRERSGHEILLHFGGDEDYYRYVGHFYPESGKFAMSAGMHISDGCSHFAAHEDEIARVEPTIVHEMTHGLLRHLPIPLWLNEGMAVNSEQRLTRLGADYWTVRELEAKHRRFWTTDTIQEFWNGSSYARPDEGNELSYDLGRILVVALSHDWDAFKRFALAAKADDGGRAAAHDVLGLELGDFVRGFLGHDDGEWGPQPSRWEKEPEREAFD